MPKPPTCTWTEEGDEQFGYGTGNGNWESDCGECWDEGTGEGPSSWNVCPYCGQKIVVVHHDDKPEVH